MELPPEIADIIIKYSNAESLLVLFDTSKWLRYMVINEVRWSRPYSFDYRYLYMKGNITSSLNRTFGNVHSSYIYFRVNRHKISRLELEYLYLATCILRNSKSLRRAWMSFVCKHMNLDYLLDIIYLENKYGKNPFLSKAYDSFRNINKILQYKEIYTKLSITIFKTLPYLFYDAYTNIAWRKSVDIDMILSNINWKNVNWAHGCGLRDQIVNADCVHVLSLLSLEADIKLIVSIHNYPHVLGEKINNYFINNYDKLQDAGFILFEGRLYSDTNEVDQYYTLQSETVNRALINESNKSLSGEFDIYYAITNNNLQVFKKCQNEYVDMKLLAIFAPIHILEYMLSINHPVYLEYITPVRITDITSNTIKGLIATGDIMIELMQLTKQQSLFLVSNRIIDSLSANILIMKYDLEIEVEYHDYQYVFDLYEQLQRI